MEIRSGGKRDNYVCLEYPDIFKHVAEVKIDSSGFPCVISCNKFKEVGKNE